MAWRWAKLSIPRLYGLDLKTNVIDVEDGESIDCENVYQNSIGVISKRKGNSVLFSKDEEDGISIAEIGTCTLGGVKYWFKFCDGKFKYASSATGSVTTISPSPAINTTDYEIWWAVAGDKLFFVDGENALRYFDGSAIGDSAILSRPAPAVAPTATAGTGYDYTFTVDNGLGESPALASPVTDEAAAATVTIDDVPYSGYTLQSGDRLRVYCRVTSTLAQWRNVTPTSGAHANGTYGVDSSGGYLLLSSTAANYAIATIALTGDLPILYSDLGVALNASAPSALNGLTVHAGRLVGWTWDGEVRCAKVTNPHSWPADTAQKEAFGYRWHYQDGEKLRACVSFKESLFLLKDTKLAVFGGIGPDDTGNNAFSFRRVESNGIGCSAGKTAKVVGDDTSANYLVWQSREGFYASTGDAPVRVGEKVETAIQEIDSSNQSRSVAFYHKREGFYYCFAGASSSEMVGYVLDLRKDGDRRVGWFKLTGINPRCIHWDDDVSYFIFGDYDGICYRERNARTSVDFSDVKYGRFTDAEVDATANTIDASGDWETGDAVVVRTAGTIPAGLTANTTYYVIVSGALIKLATSLVNAQAGTAIDITTTGSGECTIIGKKAIAAYYTTNWIKFKDAATVKKLAKPMILLNAAATSINLTMQIAVDWFSAFFDPQTITVQSDNAWGDEPWGDFVWGAGAVAVPKNMAISRRKCRSIRFKFENSRLEEDFNLKGVELTFAYIRNRGISA